MTKKTTTTIHLTQRGKDRLHDLALDAGRSQSNMVERLVDEAWASYIQRKNPGLTPRSTVRER